MRGITIAPVRLAGVYVIIALCLMAVAELLYRSTYMVLPLSFASLQWMPWVSYAIVSGVLLFLFARHAVRSARSFLEGSYQKHLLEAKSKAHELEQLKRALLTNITHEIRTPLTGIIGFADVLAEEVGGEHREFAVLIGRSGERLMNTLTAVLDLAQLESGEMKLEMRPVSLVRHAREAVALLDELAAEKGLFIELETNGCENIEASADAVAFRRITSNLLSNAIQYTQHGGVRISFESDADTISLHVADSGTGIREDFLPHIFDAFKQESEGVGIGLTICRRLADLMGATLTVDSVWQRGSRFSLRLHRADKAHQTPCDQERPIVRSSAAPERGVQGSFHIECSGLDDLEGAVLLAQDKRELRIGVSR